MEPPSLRVFRAPAKRVVKNDTPKACLKKKMTVCRTKGHENTFGVRRLDAAL